MVDHGGGRTPRLRELRLARSMTQHEVASRLERLSVVVEQRHVGVNADMVSKWERGQKQPSPIYLRLLCLLFEVTPEQLTSDCPIEQGHAPRQVSSVGVLDLLDVLGDHPAAIELIQPKVVELWRRDVLNRREVLRAMGAVPAAAALGALPLPTDHAVFHDSTTLQTVTEAVAHLERTYHDSDPWRLVTPVSAIVETIEDLLPDMRDRERRREMLALLSRANLLAGRLTFFDLHRARDARWHLDLAREAAEQAGDPVLLSAVYGHLAFLPAAKHNFEASASYIASAREALRKRPVTLVASWLNAVQGELNVQAGAYTPARHSIECAEATIGTPTAVPAPQWFDFYDGERLNGFAGLVFRKARLFAEARRYLAAALAPEPGLGPKQRAVTMLDLAGTSIEQEDIDYGSQPAVEAAAELRKAGYATALDRLAEVKNAIPNQRSQQAKLLEQCLAELS